MSWRNIILKIYIFKSDVSIYEKQITMDFMFVSFNVFIFLQEQYVGLYLA